MQPHARARLPVAMALMIGAPALGADLHVPADHATIGAAIDAASGGDTIFLAPGTYHEHDLVIDAPVTIAGTGGAVATVIDAELQGRVFIVNADFAISDLTLRNGATDDRGGAIICQAAALSIEGCIFLANTAVSSGPLTGNAGAIYCKQGELVVDGCDFVANLAVRTGYHYNSALGGAIVVTDGSVATLTWCNFEGNEVSSPIGAGSGIGGALFVAGSAGAASPPRGPSTVTIEQCTFSDNFAPLCAGAIWIQGRDGGDLPPSTLTMLDCTLVGNEAGDGGAMTVHGGGLAWLKRCKLLDNEVGPCLPGGGAVSAGFFAGTMFIECEFTMNTSMCAGGAISGAAGTSHTLIDCVLRGNVAATTGGAVYNSSYYGIPSSFTMINCLVTCNVAGADGGGVANLDGSVLEMTNCTLADNTTLGAAGGGLANIGQFLPAQGAPVPSIATVGNTIFWSNEGVAGATTTQIDDPDGGVTLTHSIVQDGWFGPGTNNQESDPLFAGPGEPCGENYRLLETSPAIDSGSNAIVPADVTHDLDGNPRFLDDPSTPDAGTGESPIVDIGPYEFAYQGTCDGDLDGSGTVDNGDLGLLLGNWGGTGTGDINADGTVDGRDLGLLLAAWGPCP